MPASERLSELAHLRAKYTGENYQLALEQLRGSDNLQPIPKASDSQLLLESQVMNYLGRGGNLWAHPLGMEKIILSGSNYPVIVLDSHTQWPSRDVVRVSTHALDELLPVAERNVQVHGPVGLRVQKVAGRDLHLSSVGTQSRVILRGVPGTSWEDELQKQWEKFSDSEDMTPLWLAPTLTGAERRDLESLPEHWDSRGGLAWIGSGMLRRLALLHSSVNICTASSWITGDEWIFELDGAPRVPLDHDTFVRRIADSIWGLNLRIYRRNCYCAIAGYEAGYQCTYFLHPVDKSLSGTLQFRFRNGAIPGPEEMRATFVAVNAPAGWISRVLPGDSGNSKGEEA